MTLCPGQTYINTKQDRWPLDKDRPEYTIRHTIGVKGVLGGEYSYNQTEIGVRKRQWLGSWGRLDLTILAAAQWEKVPFPLLVTAPTCISYVEQEGTLNMLHNMEFFMDRRVFWQLSLNMNGKIFNRIPLLKKLKLREFIAFKGVWGMLTDKNNPEKCPDDGLLFQFPDGSTSPDMHEPYMELVAGVRNIFKVFGVDYVRRLNYRKPDTSMNGFRFNLTFSF